MQISQTKLKIDVINETVEKAKLKAESFDVIVIWDTLEHLYNPYLALSKSYDWLKNGGYIFINIPNIDSVFARLFRSRWWFIESMHLYYFSPRTINMYFKKIGFRYLQKKRHIQTLKLGYLISKIKPYSYFCYNVANNIIKILKLKNLNISYCAGQIIIVGQK